MRRPGGRPPCFRGWESHPAIEYACFCLIAWSSCIAGSDYPTWGAISVPVNTAYKRDETAYILNDAEAVGMVAHESLIEVASQAAALSSSVVHKLVVNTGIAAGDDLQVGPGWRDFSQVLSEVQLEMSLPQVSPQADSMLVYTSGTTGNPKGVRVSHLMYVAAGQGFAHWTEASQDDRFFHVSPLLPRQRTVLLNHGRIGQRRDFGGGGPIQRLPVLGPSAEGRSHGGELYWHDDARSGQTAGISAGP